MARKTRTRSSRKTRKQRGGNYLNDYEKKEVMQAAADKKRSENAAAARVAERAARTPAAIKAAKNANVAAYREHAKALDAIKNAGLGPAPKKQSEHRNAANELHKRIEEGHHQLTSTRRY